MKYRHLLICILVFASCNNKETEQEINTYTLSGDTILVDDQSIISAKIQTGIVEDVSFQKEMISTGTVRAIPNFYAEIAPPFSGRVTKVYLKLGMKTKPGTPLFEMASPDFTDVQKSFFQARSERNSAKANLERQQDLYEHGVAAQRDLEEAQTNFDMQKQEFDNAAAGLRIYGVNTNNFSLGQPLIITSPIAGEVISNEIVLGHYIRADDEPRAKIARLDKVWVAGEVKEKDIAFVNRLDKAEITLAAYPGKKITGNIYHVDEIVDEETRSVKVLMECVNEDHTLKPGMYVNVTFIDKPQNTLFVPAKAVLQYNDRSFVFVELSPGKYQRKFVETGNTVGDNIIIISGLNNNETIITDGAFYLLDAK